MSRRNQDRLNDTFSESEPEPMDDQAVEWEALALTLSCGGAFVPAAMQREAPLRTVHTPGHCAYLLREDDPACCLALDASLQDERRFCESVSRLLHDTRNLKNFMSEGILWNMN